MEGTISVLLKKVYILLILFGKAQHARGVAKPAALPIDARVVASGGLALGAVRLLGGAQVPQKQGGGHHRLLRAPRVGHGHPRRGGDALFVQLPGRGDKLRRPHGAPVPYRLRARHRRVVRVGAEPRHQVEEGLHVAVGLHHLVDGRAAVFAFAGAGPRVGQEALPNVGAEVGLLPQNPEDKGGAHAGRRLRLGGVLHRRGKGDAGAVAQLKERVAYLLRAFLPLGEDRLIGLLVFFGNREELLLLLLVFFYLILLLLHLVTRVKLGRLAGVQRLLFLLRFGLYAAQLGKTVLHVLVDGVYLVLFPHEFGERLFAGGELLLQGRNSRGLLYNLAPQRGDRDGALLDFLLRLFNLRVQRGDIAGERLLFGPRGIQHLLPLRNLELELVVLGLEFGLLLGAQNLRLRRGDSDKRLVRKAPQYHSHHKRGYVAPRTLHVSYILP